jgi:hypothetical protein
MYMVPIEDVVYYVGVVLRCMISSGVEACSAICVRVASRRRHKRVIPVKVVSDLDEAQL